MNNEKFYTEIVSAIKNLYELSASNLVAIYDGSDNTVLKSLTNVGDIIVKISKRDKSAESLEQEAFVLQELKKNSVLVPEYLKNKKNSHFFTIDNHKVVCSKFINGEKIGLEQKPNPELIVSAAQALANLHRAGSQIKSLKFERNIFTELHRLGERRNAFLDTYEEAEDFIELVSFYQKKMHEVSEHEGSGFIHNDYRIHNVLVDNNKITAILDFDWSTIGPFKKDLAHAALEWSFADGNDSPWKDVFSLFLKTYLASMNIGSEDIRSWIVFSALSDACTYYIDRLPEGKPDKKKKMQSYMHLKALYFHNMDDDSFGRSFC